MRLGAIQGVYVPAVRACLSVRGADACMDVPGVSGVLPLRQTVPCGALASLACQAQQGGACGTMGAATLVR